MPTMTHRLRRLLGVKLPLDNRREPELGCSHSTSTIESVHHDIEN
jgi:hypothetical protein